MRIHVIGAGGFVGSAFVRHFQAQGWEVLGVTRENYHNFVGTESDVLVDAAGNSRKYWAEDKPFEEFHASVGHRLATLRDFSTRLHVHVSSVDVYDDLASSAATSEESNAVGHGSHYGFHKRMAEQMVEHYASRWLILRLAGMVGLGLRKNPVFDILNGHPLRIHPDSKYQFMPTDAVAAVAGRLIAEDVAGEIFNVCGAGLISPHEIAELAETELNLSELSVDARPRIVDVNIEKISSRAPMPQTHESVAAFIDRSRASL